MAYVMENIALYENQSIIQTNVVVKHNMIYSRDTPVKQLNYTRLNLDEYILIAGETVVGDFTRWQQEGLCYAEELVLLGATTIIFPIDIQYTHQLRKNVERAKAALRTFPLDYCLFLRVPLPLLNSSIVRYCKQHLIPGIITVLENHQDLLAVSWSWIKEAIFPYKLVFFPQFKKRELHSEASWAQILKNALLPHSETPLIEHLPLNKKILKITGLYPFKGMIRSNGEVSYNLIHEKYENCLSNNENSYYDKIECTIFKNKVIRARNQVLLSNSIGEELLIKVPGFFQ